ncbi:DUF423 domain-containing protein [Aidingimonas lacisalsi]|uniref:DUF423 domain-containing protein n=1 Tax=Aidingimonas lacisalsi TaxID=2604086 RepID=UPI0011D19B21|nr:DUF423 domain-containing protein [Aidingimonas lacisalsi]
MPFRIAWIAVALSGFITVAAGAFGAHGLGDQLSPHMLDAFNTAVRYQAWHTLACLGVMAWRQSLAVKGQSLTLWLWASGMVLFSGSLYGLTLTGLSMLGSMTPLGGVLLMAGWLTLGWSGWRYQSASGSV